MKIEATLARGEARSVNTDEPQIAVSVIVPVSERPHDLVDLYRDYSRELGRFEPKHEFVFVSQPWFTKLTEPLKELAAAGESISVFQVGQAVGEAALVKLGAAQSRGDIVLTLPCYRRIVASSLPGLLAALEGGADMAVARRWPRRDSWINRLQNRAFHALLRRSGSGRIHDVACGVRAMRREVLDDIPLYGDYYRFLPLLALREGYKVEEVDCPQHPADLQPRVYSPGVYLRRLIDIFGIFFLLRFTEKPLRFFGLLGAGFSITGGVVLLVLFIERLGGQGIANRPLLLLGVLLFVLGVQAIALGLIGEIIVHLHAPRGRFYRVRSR